MKNLNKVVTIKEEVDIDLEDPENDKTEKDMRKNKLEITHKVELAYYHHNIKFLKQIK